MFGFGRNQRAQKAIRHTLALYLPGQEKVWDAIITSSRAATDSAIESIKKDGNPYQATAMLVATYLHDRFQEMDDDRKRLMLHAVWDDNVNYQPRLFKFTVHMVKALANLEYGDKPLIPPGTTHTFLREIAAAFTDQDGAKNRIAAYFIKCAG